MMKPGLPRAVLLLPILAGCAAQPDKTASFGTPQDARAPTPARIAFALFLDVCVQNLGRRADMERQAVSRQFRSVDAAGWRSDQTGEAVRVWAANANGPAWQTPVVIAVPDSGSTCAVRIRSTDIAQARNLAAEMATVYSRSGGRVTLHTSRGPADAPTLVSYRVVSNQLPASEWGFSASLSSDGHVWYMAMMMPGATVQREGTGQAAMTPGRSRL